MGRSVNSPILLEQVLTSFPAHVVMKFGKLKQEKLKKSLSLRSQMPSIYQTR
jgi:hypothetical protein